MLKFVLLALLGRKKMHGYELKAVFDELLGAVWPLNITQIYGALSKLEDEGLAECEVVPQSNVPNRKVYSLTAKGRDELREWFEQPNAGPVRLRDEVFLKVLLADMVEGAKTADVIGRQRQAHLRSLAELSQVQANDDVAPPTALLLDGASLRLEAVLQWLDRCEDTLKARKR